jgi:hypothetical protein
MKPYWIQPHLRAVGVPLDVDVWRLTAIARENVETVRAKAENGGYRSEG